MVFCLALLGRSLLIPFSFMPKKQKPLQKKGFFFGAEKGIRPAILGQYRRQPGELKNHSPDGFLPPLTLRPFPSRPFILLLCKQKKPMLCIGFFVWWGWRGSNPRPLRCERSALTSWATSPAQDIFYNKSALNATPKFHSKENSGEVCEFYLS